MLTEGGLKYEADGELSEEEWAQGAREMLRQHKVRQQEKLDHLHTFSESRNNAARYHADRAERSYFGSSLSSSSS